MMRFLQDEATCSSERCDSLSCSGRHHQNVEMNLKEMWRLRPVLNQILASAAKEGRLTYGLHACLKVLQICPQSVLICILPVNNSSKTNNNGQIDDAGQGILHRLLEAFCFENDIKLLKIEPGGDTGQPMPRLMENAANNKIRNANVMAHPLDAGCILIHCSEESELGEHDRQFIQLYSLISQSCQSPWPCLPVDPR